MGRIYCRIAEIEVIAHTICVGLISGAAKLDDIMRLEKMAVRLSQPLILAHRHQASKLPRTKVQ